MQFSEATKYTEQQSSEAHSLMASTEKDSWPVYPTRSDKHGKPVSSTNFDNSSRTKHCCANINPSKHRN